MINSLRGEFQATLGGEPVAFDTTLGTIASIEDRCGDLPIVDIINKAVFGRRARDRMALLAAALASTGLEVREADALAAGASMGEVETFLLALMGALGFEIMPRGAAEERKLPLDGGHSGDAGWNSPSVP